MLKGGVRCVTPGPHDRPTPGKKDQHSVLFIGQWPDAVDPGPHDRPTPGKHQ